MDNWKAYLEHVKAMRKEYHDNAGIMTPYESQTISREIDRATRGSLSHMFQRY